MRLFLLLLAPVVVLHADPKVVSALAEKNTAQAAATLPNIVLILADDLGYGDVRCYNANSKVPTPNIDKLASEGMRFTDAHSPATVCTPSRYSLMTGQMAFRVPNGGTVFQGVVGPSLIAKGRLTLPAMLQDAGEHLEGHHCLGAPILDADGTAMASLWITGPSQRLSEERMVKLAPVVKKAGAMVTTALHGKPMKEILA